MSAASQGSTRPRRSLRDLVNLGLGVTAVVLVLCVASGAWSFAELSEVRSELVDEVDPAAKESVSMYAATLDQQNRIRGFVLLGDFGQANEVGPLRESMAASERVLRELLSERPEATARLDELTSATQRWQDGPADALLAIGLSGDEPTAEDLERSVDAFQAVREAYQGLEAELTLERQQIRASIDASATRLAITMAIIAALFTVVILVVWLGLRRLVLAPLSTTVDDAQRIAGGDLDRSVAVAGLAELAEVGAALEQVREELVTQLRAVEEREADLERSNAELEQFAYVASHDLQEPLRKVASFCQMLERRYKGQLDERADTYIEFAVDGATRMQELINDLLAFSRVGRTTDRFEQVSLDEVLDRALQNLDGALVDSAAVVHRQPLPRVVGDRSLLTALFQNLVGNAVKFRSEDRPEVAVGAAERDGMVEVTVRDNGIGIPEEYRDRVFVIFQRLHGRSEYEGTGIGLSLVRKIVEFHGGTISVQDNGDGPGTTFRFTLPTQMDPHSPNPRERRAE